MCDIQSKAFEEHKRFYAGKLKLLNTGSFLRHDDKEFR